MILSHLLIFIPNNITSMCKRQQFCRIYGFDAVICNIHQWTLILVIDDRFPKSRSVYLYCKPLHHLTIKVIQILTLCTMSALVLLEGEKQWGECLCHFSPQPNHLMLLKIRHRKFKPQSYHISALLLSFEKSLITHVDTVVSWEKHFASNHFSQDAGGRPDIH